MGNFFRSNTKFSALMEFNKNRDYTFEPLKKVDNGGSFLGKLETDKIN